MLPDLQELLKFRHDAVIRTYCRSFGAEQERGDALFKNMLKYLWVSKKHQMEREKNPNDPTLQFSFVMHEEMRDMDNMWHQFILSTPDYFDFCTRYFGDYMHHIPGVAENSVPEEAEFSQDMERYLSYVYDHLGEETVREWFSSHLN